MHWRRQVSRGVERNTWDLITIGGPVVIHATIVFDFKAYRVLIADSPGAKFTTWTPLDPCADLEAAQAAGRAEVERRAAEAVGR
jgi:hypothetical protein